MTVTGRRASLASRDVSRTRVVDRARPPRRAWPEPPLRDSAGISPDFAHQRDGVNVSPRTAPAMIAEGRA